MIKEFVGLLSSLRRAKEEKHFASEKEIDQKFIKYGTKKKCQHKGEKEEPTITI